MRLEFYTINDPSTDVIDTSTLIWDLQENGVSLLGQDTSTLNRFYGYYVNSSCLKAVPRVSLPMSPETATKWMQKCGLAPKFWSGPFWKGNVEKLDKFARSKPNIYSTRLARMITEATITPDFIQEYVASIRELKPPALAYSIGAVGEVEDDKEEALVIKFNETGAVLSIAPPTVNL